MKKATKTLVKWPKVTPTTITTITLLLTILILAKLRFISFWFISLIAWEIFWVIGQKLKNNYFQPIFKQFSTKLLRISEISLKSVENLIKNHTLEIKYRVIKLILHNNNSFWPFFNRKEIDLKWRHISVLANKMTNETTSHSIVTVKWLEGEQGAEWVAGVNISEIPQCFWPNQTRTWPNWQTVIVTAAYLNLVMDNFPISTIR